MTYGIWLSTASQPLLPPSQTRRQNRRSVAPADQDSWQRQRMIRPARMPRLGGEAQTISGLRGGLDHHFRKISVRISHRIRIHSHALAQQQSRTAQFVFKLRGVAARQRIVIEAVRADLDQFIMSIMVIMAITAMMAGVAVMPVAARFDDLRPTHQR